MESVGAIAMHQAGGGAGASGAPDFFRKGGAAVNTDRHVRAVDRPDVLQRAYLGDGVYAAFDGTGVWLTAEDGTRATDAIYLEPEVYDALRRFVNEVNE